MNQETAKDLCKLLLKNFNGTNLIKIHEKINREPLKNFHSWANDKPLEGGLLIEDSYGTKLWILIIKWRDNDDYYIVIYPDDHNTSPVAELHTVKSKDNKLLLTWNYCPSKRDGRNEERKKYFNDHFLGCDVLISLPTDQSEAEEFLMELASLVHNRLKADELSEDAPEVREGFPEGKIFERIHKSRERNSIIIHQFKTEALKLNGCLECSCCGFDFSTEYGELGNEFIEVHHLKPLSAMQENGEMTSKEDLVLVCSICHSMIHRRRPWLTKFELRSILKKCQ